MNIGEAKDGVGRGVVYTPDGPMVPGEAKYLGSGQWEITVEPGPPQESGVITSVNDTIVFVRYGGDKHSKATNPCDLEFEFPSEEK